MIQESFREREARLEGLKAAVGRMAHDFKNLLVPQIGYVSLLQEELGNAAENAIRYLDKLELANKRADQTLEAILMAVRPRRRFSPRMADFKSVIEEELELWRGSLAGKPLVAICSDLVACPLNLDVDQWRASIQHLLANARWAMPSGGELKVTLRRAELTEDESRELDVSGGPGFTLRIADTGIGMTADLATRVFDPFFSTRSKGQGGGLGLTLVHSVVRLHGGQVWLETKPESGTTVAIWIPEGGAPAN